MKLIQNNQDFKWVGEGISIQKRRKKIRYEAFILRDLKIEIGDFVLVRNDDALDPEDFMTCYVAQVKNLFETGDEIDPYQAQVQWFSRVLELPTYAIKLFKNAGHELEIVKDKRSSWHDVIDAETIFKKCEVLFLPSDCDFESALSEYKDHSELETPVFFCRYVFTGTSLVEIKDNLKNDPAKISLTNGSNKMNGFVSHNEMPRIDDIAYEKSRSPNKIHDRYCAISVGSPSKIPRVVIKKIDDKILESQKKNVRIFVADSNIENIEDVANIFLNKLKLEKQEEHKNLEKKSVIHNLTSQSGDPEKGITDTGLMDYDSSSKSKTSNTPQKMKNYPLKFNTKFCKNVFAYNTRNSPKKNASEECQSLCSPTKRPKMTKLDDLILKPPSTKAINFPDENFLKSNLGKNKKKCQKKQCDSDIAEKHKLKNNQIDDNSVSSDKEIDSLSIFHRSRSLIDKAVASPSRKSVKKAATDTKKTSPKKYNDLENSDSYSTPKKKLKFVDGFEEFRLTRSGRRVKAVSYSEEKNETSMISAATPTKKLPRFVLNNVSDDSDSDNFEASSHSSDDDSLSGVSLLDVTSPNKTKRSFKKKATAKKSRDSLSKRTSSCKKNLIDLSIPERKTPLRTPKNALEESRQRLHVSSVPSSLPCRDEEYSDIYSFVKGCLCAETGGCMYISGVPGTGKTATVHEVVRNLEEEKELGEVPIFKFVEVNGMWMTDPYQCYVQIFKALTGKSIAPQQAADLLEKRFTENGPKKDAVVLLVDELDRLWTRKQTVMYNIFDWPSKKNSKLIVLAIANTMDLPERMMMNRISSRLGLTRKTFQPYTFKQLQEILMSRIQELKVFDPDAVQLVARKVAAVSGDARRALDICRFATETVKVGPTTKKGQKILVGMEHVDKALQQMFSSPVISAIRSSSKMVKLFFQCMLSEFTQSGLEETTLLKVHRQLISTCRFEGWNPPNSTEILRICADLAAAHLILVDNFKNDSYMKIRLNVSSDDVTYALTLM